jgi:cytochrome c oxidase subunit II
LLRRLDAEEDEELKMRFPTRRGKWAGAAVVALIACVVLSACDRSPSILEPAGPIAATQEGIAWLIFGLSAFIFVAVTAVLLYSIVRFRARPGSPDARQVHGNTSIEIIWTVVPTAILFIILYVTISTMFALAEPANANPLVVRAVAHQWWWEFQYADSGVVSADELHIPVGRVVHLELFSDNVIHSLWVPQLGGKTDVIPGHDNTMWLKADIADTYRGECTEYCGIQHAHMDFVVVAQPTTAFQAWVASAQGPAIAPAKGGTEALGQQVFLKSGCISCHVIDGVTNVPGVKIGPNLTHFGSRKLIAGGVLDNTPPNLAEWIRNAQGVKEGSDMPSFGTNTINQNQLDQLVAYLESLK